jgi:DNA polymerase-3 subunit alpha
MLSKEELSKIRFVNTHLHTMYSILDGVGTVSDHICQNLHKGHEGMAITDHGVMSGCIQLYKMSKDKDFLKKIGRDKPVPIIMGSELYITRSISERNPEKKYNHITVLAKNEVGYRNLCELTSIASKEDHFYSRPRIELSELFKYKEGLIITSGCFIGMIPQAIYRETGEEEDLLLMFKKEFGDDFYLELHLSDISKVWEKTLKKHVNQGFNPQEKVNRRIIELGKQHNIKTVISLDSHMPKKEHHFIQSIMIWNSPSGKDGWHFPDAYYTMSVEEMYNKCQKVCPYIDDQLFIDSCAASIEILDKCKDCKLEFEPLLPAMQYQEHPVNTEKELNDTLEARLDQYQKDYAEKDKDFAQLLEVSRTDYALRTALKVIVNNKKVDLDDDIARERLTMETNTIQRNGVVKLIDYFMLLEDVTKFVRENGHARGFGRGCLAADALVLTKEHGYKKIQDVKSGEHVYTKSGDSKAVIKTFEHSVELDEKLVKIKTEKSFGSITFTKNHKIYGIKPKHTQQFGGANPEKRKKYIIENKPEWIEAGNIQKDDFLFVAYPKREEIIQSDVDLSKFIDDDSKTFYVDGNEIVRVNPLTKTEEFRFPKVIKFNEDFAYMLGKWIGDGWVTTHAKRRKFLIGLAFNSKDKKEIDKTFNYFESLGLKPKLAVAQNKSLTQMYIYNKPIANYIRSLFPEYKNTSGTKYLGDLKKLPNKLLTSLMLGLQSADGHVGYGKNRAEMVDTTSFRLATEIKEALLYLNIPSSIITRAEFKSSKYLCKESYKVKFLGLTHSLKIKKDYKFANGYFVKVLDTEEVMGIGKVYDLMVADDPSFLTSNYVVHNSGAGSLLAYALDITDVDPLIWGLLFERFLTKERIGRKDFSVPEVPKSSK